MKYVITLNDKKYEVEVEKGQATAVYAGKAEEYSTTPAPAAPVAAPAPAAAPVQAAPAAAPGEGAPVKAPMPGTILDVRCTVGQQVKRGQALFVLEAMKMENEVASPADGVVTSILVTKGASVQTDETIATVA
ncbi:MAG: biotin/lipoyl-binding protein [Solobacterium sp.]|nr:biotin/lipoyl-binding protein [Solobacterium sp.]